MISIDFKFDIGEWVCVKTPITTSSSTESNMCKQSSILPNPMRVTKREYHDLGEVGHIKYYWTRSVFMKNDHGGLHMAHGIDLTRFSEQELMLFDWQWYLRIAPMPEA